MTETIKLVDFARRNGLGVTINLMSPMGGADGRAELFFDEEFWTEFRKLVNANHQIRSDWDWNLDLRIGCPSGFEKVHVAPYGDVTGCALQAPSFGIVREEPLEAIVARMRAFHHYPKRSPHCLVGVDTEYIGDYMAYQRHYDSVPYPIADNPKWVQDRVLRGSPVASARAELPRLSSQR